MNKVKGLMELLGIKPVKEEYSAGGMLIDLALNTNHDAKHIASAAEDMLDMIGYVGDKPDKEALHGAAATAASASDFAKKVQAELEKRAKASKE
jgi:hypothetical protein